MGQRQPVGTSHKCLPFLTIRTDVLTGFSRLLQYENLLNFQIPEVLTGLKKSGFSADEDV